MRNILKKELKLSASPLAFCFIPFALMFFIPGYPILCGAFFVTLGIFQSFQYAREANDILFSVLLPIAKRDVVKGKYSFVCFIELCAFALMTAVTLLRMTVFSASVVYRNNALMNANPFALGMALLLFGLFNRIFLAGFFKTAYHQGKPFILYSIVCFLTLSAGEALHHFPGLEALNAFGFDHMGLQLLLLCCGAGLFVLLTLGSMFRSCRNFEKTDL